MDDEMKYRIWIVILIALLIGALGLVFLFYAKNEQNEECVRQTIGGVIDIGDICTQYQARDEQND